MNEYYINVLISVMAYIKSINLNGRLHKIIKKKTTTEWIIAGLIYYFYLTFENNVFKQPSSNLSNVFIHCTIHKRNRLMCITIRIIPFQLNVYLYFGRQFGAIVHSARA